MAEQAIKQNTGKLVKASARYVHIAPRKMQLVTNLVKNMNAGEAIIQLSHLNKKAALILNKLLKSAVANAKNNFSMDPEKLFIKSINTNIGKVMKRYMARARGSAFVIRRKTSHVNVVLEEKKKAKPSMAKFTFLRKKGEEKAQISSDQKEATSEKMPKEEGRKGQVFKTEEQLKMNKIQQKRRLFDRRGGE